MPVNLPRRGSTVGMVTASLVSGRNSSTTLSPESSYARSKIQGAREIDGGTDNCTGSRDVTTSSPMVSGTSQRVIWKTSQYRYGPTRTN